MEQQIDSAAVIGAGIMGHGVAQLLAENGVRVSLIDTSREQLDCARSWIADNLGYMVELDLLAPERVPAILERIRFISDIPGGLSGAGYVLEAVTENFALKRELWSQLSEAADADAILASNTSSYDIDELAAGVAHPERAIGTHWFHPPQITPCVEVIPSSETSRESVDRTFQFLASLGKVPTLCKSAPGFVANRIQLAMVREAIALVEEGLATPAEVDRIVTTSFGFRLGAYGPFEIIDQAGADTYRSVFAYLHARIPGGQFRPSELLEDQVETGKLGLKSGSGFYEYGSGAADAMRRERDRKYYARLDLARKEWEEENRP